MTTTDPFDRIPDTSGEYAGTVLETTQERAARTDAAPPADPWWTCPAHGGELAYLPERNSDPADREDHWSCTVVGCKFERHTS
jgi:hypothetical protein